MNTKNNRENLIAARQSVGFSRRHFLRGLGACLALPAFESLRPLRLSAAETSISPSLATTATGAPLRTAFVFFPNGAIPAAWWPGEAKQDYDLSKTLQPLAAVRK